MLRYQRRGGHFLEILELVPGGGGVHQRIHYVPLAGGIGHEESKWHPCNVARITRRIEPEGYTLVHDGPLPPALRTARHPALEAECLATPDSPEPWEIYADWLIAQGDLRGEVAQLLLRGATEDALVMFGVRIAELFGDRGEAVRNALELTWRHGFPVGATLRVDQHVHAMLEGLIGDFLLSPVATFVTALEVAEPRGGAIWGSLLEAVIRADPDRRLRSLSLVDGPPIVSADRTVGHFAELWPRLRHLEALRIESERAGWLSTAALPGLRRLVRASSHLGAEELSAVAMRSWPVLEHLDLQLGHDTVLPPTVAFTLEAMFRANGMPRLVHLGLRACPQLDDVLGAAIAAGFLERLRTLDLSDNVIDPERLLARAAALRHLDVVDVARCGLARELLAQLREVLPNLRA